MLTMKVVQALTVAPTKTPTITKAIWRYEARSFSAFESTFRDRAAGKAQLKEFYKLTHPDFFGSAPEKIRGENEASM